MRIEDHPLMAQIKADVEKTNQQQRIEAELAEAERKRLRHEQGTYLRKQSNEFIQKYEEARIQMHALLGQVWEANQEFSRVTGQPSPDFHENLFLEINLPTLLPTNNWAAQNFSTTRAAVTAYFSNRGKWV